MVFNGPIIPKFNSTIAELIQSEIKTFAKCLENFTGGTAVLCLPTVSNIMMDRCIWYFARQYDLVILNLGPTMCGRVCVLKKSSIKPNLRESVDKWLSEHNRDDDAFDVEIVNTVIAKGCGLDIKTAFDLFWGTPDVAPLIFPNPFLEVIYRPVPHCACGHTITTTDAAPIDPTLSREYEDPSTSNTMPCEPVCYLNGTDLTAPPNSTVTINDEEEDLGSDSDEELLGAMVDISLSERRPMFNVHRMLERQQQLIPDCDTTTRFVLNLPKFPLIEQVNAPNIEAEYIKWLQIYVQNPVIVCAAYSYENVLRKFNRLSQYAVELYGFPSQYEIEDLAEIYSVDPRTIKMYNNQHALLLSSSNEEAMKALAVHRSQVFSRPVCYSSLDSMFMICTVKLNSNCPATDCCELCKRFAWLLE